MLGDSLRRRHAAKQSDPSDRPVRPKSPHGRPWLNWWRWLLLAVAILFASFGTGYLLAARVLFPAPETSGAGLSVPELYGRTAGEAERMIRDLGLLPGQSTTMTSREVREGRVLAQRPVPGQQLRRGATVDIVVSAGPPSPVVPAVAGLGTGTARELLEALGFRVEVQQVPSLAPAGTVTRTEPAAGVAPTLPATVTLVVSAGQPQPDSVDADGLAWP